VLPVEAAIEVPADAVEDVLLYQGQRNERTVRGHGGDDLQQVVVNRYGSPS
jgi:hypothetical protein